MLKDSHLILIVLIPTHLFIGHSFTQTFVLLLQLLHYILHLLTICHLLLVISHQRVKYSPHHLGKVYIPLVVPNIQAINDLLQSSQINRSYPFIPHRLRQLHQETRKFRGFHIVISSWVEECPSSQKSLNILLFQSKYL